MFYHAASNQYINEGMAFEIDGIQYPQNWLNLSSAEEKAAAGLSEVTTFSQREDDRFYWVNENRSGGVITITNTPKDLVGLKAQWKAQINQMAYAMLLPSDWIVTKALETSSSVPAAWSSYRASVRSTAQAAVAAIDAAADVPSLQSAIQVTWPTDPNYVPMIQEAPL